MPRYYVEGNTHCTITRAHSAQAAEKHMRNDLGSYGGPYRARLATEEDLENVRAMGGNTHEIHED